MPSTTKVAMPPAEPPLRLRPMVGSIVTHRGVQLTAVLWIGGYLLVLLLARGSLPFDRPAVASLPFGLQMAGPTIGLMEIFVLMVLVFFLTRARTVPDMAKRAPDTAVAWRETLLILGYAALGQIGGWFGARALGYQPFSFHLAGSVFGCTVTPRGARSRSGRSIISSSLRSCRICTFGAGMATMSSICVRPTAQTIPW